MSFKNEIILPILKSIKDFSGSNAFCINHEFFTYEQFGQATLKIQKELQVVAAGEKFIGIITNDDLETYASIIAIWLEGKAFIPLHSLQPLNRSLEIIEQVELKIVLDSLGLVDFEECSVINTSALNNVSGEVSFVSEISELELTYILFTSGTTGKPKGVTINRENITAFVKAFQKAGINLDENDRCLQCFDLTFDVSVQSYLIPLLSGACIYTIPTSQIKFMYAYELLEDYQLTFGAMAPSMLRFLRPYFSEINIQSMRCCIVTAEASPADLIAEWHDCIPNADIYDFYGPTEATIYCTYYKIDFSKGIKSYNGLLSIGKPMDGMKTLIIDEEMKILEDGIKGELCISGKQLTQGYWQNDIINRNAFFDISVDGAYERFYHTGDLCYIDEEGDILYSGRIDSQAKIQGYRVELGEIEFHAREYLEGRNAVAIPFVGSSGNTEISLIIESKDLNLKNLDKHLKSKMPNYMIPSIYRNVEVFPINTNGKIDRNNLKNLI